MTVARPSPRASTPRQTAGHAEAPLSDTPAKLVHAALSLFAKHGIEAVSLRQITLAAGQSNESAVHYHFKNKAGLVAAVLDFVNAQLAPMQAQVLEQLKTIATERPPTVREIVSGGMMPFVLLHAQSATGRKAIRFLSRLTWQSNDGGPGILINKLWPYYQLLEVYLLQALPHKPRAALQFHGVLGVSSVIHGLADTRLLGKEPTLGITALFAGQPMLLLDYFIDYIVGGLMSESSPTGTSQAPARS